MDHEDDDFSGCLVDVSNVSLSDLEAFSNAQLAAALGEVMAAGDAPVSAGFSSRLSALKKPSRAIQDTSPV